MGIKKGTGKVWGDRNFHDSDCADSFIGSYIHRNLLNSHILNTCGLLYIN